MKLNRQNLLRETRRQALAWLTLSAIFAVPFASAGAQQQQQQRNQPATAKSAVGKSQKLTEEQRIAHVLNRLGFGARSGDVARVKQMSLNKYIEQQLNPDKIDDSAVEARLQKFDSLKMSNADLFAVYPDPTAVMTIVARNNGLNPKQLRGDLKADKKTATTANGTSTDSMMTAKIGDAAMQNAMPNSMPNQMPNAASPKPIQPNQMTEDQKQIYQAQVKEIYQEYGLKRPVEIMQQLNAARIVRAVYSEKQLQEQMVDFWSNHFNIYAGKGADRWYLTEYDRDVIRPNALGNFRDLLAATAKSPAMLFYLDNFQSVSPNNNQNENPRAQRLRQILAENKGELPPVVRERIKSEFNLNDQQIDQRIKQFQNQAKNRRGINENYARELMELHTLGVDGGYTQKDVQEVARCFTGWTINDARGYRKAGKDLLNDKDQKAMNGLARLAGLPVDADSGTFYFNPKQHDNGEKTVLGQKIPAGGGMDDGLKVIDILVKQPATAKFISRKLAVKFVNDNPSDALVNRMAEAFLKSNGDIKTTLRAMIASPEFFAPENYRAKIKTPFEVMASSLRVLDAETNANPPLQGLLGKMGEPLYGWIAPTGYPDKAEDWVNTGALLERLNFGLALASNRIPGTKVDLTKFTGRDPDDKEKVMNAFLAAILNNEVSPNTRATLEKQLNQPLPEPKLAANSADGETTEMTAMNNQKADRKLGLNRQANRLLPASGNPEVVKIVGLILGSPEFQRQ